MRDRQDIRVTLRLVSVLLLVAALGLIAYRPCAVVIHWDRYAGADWLQLLNSLLNQVRMNELPLALTLVVVAVALWLFQRPLARLIVPKAGATCLECGYSLRGIKGTQCPECGADVKRA